MQIVRVISAIPYGMIETGGHEMDFADVLDGIAKPAPTEDEGSYRASGAASVPFWLTPISVLVRPAAAPLLAVIAPS